MFRYNDEDRKLEAEILAQEKTAAVTPAVVPGLGLSSLGGGGISGEIDSLIKVSSEIDPVAAHRVRNKLAANRRCMQDLVNDFIRDTKGNI